MLKICEFFEVQKGAVTGDTDEFVLVENCSQYDTALQNYSIVCRRYNLDQVLQWVNDEGFGMQGYVSDCFEGGLYKVALDIVKSSLAISYYTSEFVKQHGSSQAFLDYYGRGDNGIAFAEQQTEIPQDSFVGLESLQGLSDNDGIPEDQAANINTPESIQSFAADDFEEVLPPPVYPSEQQVYQPEPLAYQPEQPVYQQEQQAYQPEQSVYPPEQQAYQSEPSAYQQEQEPEYLQKEKLLTDEEYEALTAPSFTIPEKSVETAELPEEEKISAIQHGVEYAVECEGLDVEGVTFKDGKVSIPFSALNNLVSCMVQAVSKIATEEVNGIQVLTKDDRADAAGLVDQYAPSVVKTFLIKEILNAESDAEIIRITAILNDFCTYLRDCNIDKM